jgi:hypothetical protein
MKRLDQWLSTTKSHPEIEHFTTWKVIEEVDTAQVRTVKMVESMLDQLVGESYLERARAALPPSEFRSLIQSRMPTTKILKRGCFGEVLAIRILEGFHNYHVPVKKLRFRTAGHDVPKATDVLAITMSLDGKIEVIGYVEAKLRTTTRDLDTVLNDAHDQLRKDCEQPTPAIIGFAASVLDYANDPLFDTFMEYLHDRAETDSRAHHVMLVVERNLWTPDYLSDLKDCEDILEPLHIHVVLVDELATLVDTVYQEIGIQVFDDDE